MTRLYYLHSQHKKKKKEKLKDSRRVAKTPLMSTRLANELSEGDLDTHAGRLADLHRRIIL